MGSSGGQNTLQEVLCASCYTPLAATLGETIPFSMTVEQETRASLSLSIFRRICYPSNLPNGVLSTFSHYKLMGLLYVLCFSPLQVTPSADPITLSSL